MVKDNFVGTWMLVSSEANLADGTIVHPYGKNAIGMLTYDHSGHMSAQVMHPDRPLFVSGDMRNGTPEEIKAAFDGYTAYFGNYEVDDQEGSVTHHVLGSHFPNLVGQDQKWFFAFSSNRLTLRTPPIPTSGTTVTLAFVWERKK